MLRKVFIVSIIVLITLLLLWGAYYLAFQRQSAPTAPETTAPASSIESEPTSERQIQSSDAISPLLDASISSPALSSDGQLLYYIHKDSSDIFQLQTWNQEKTLLSSPDVNNVIAGIWSRNKEYLILKTTETSGTRYSLLSLSNDSITPLKKGIEYLTWDTLSDRIVYSYREAQTNNLSINIAQRDGSQWKEIANADTVPVKIAAIPQSTSYAFWAQPSNTRKPALYTANASGGDKRELFSGKFGADYLWSPNGESILMSWAPEKDGSKMILSLINKNGGQYQDLNLPTLVSKCVWGNQGMYVYCAMPGALPEGTVMPDDYNSRKVLTKDTFWRIDTKTGEKERLVELDAIDRSFDATSLMIMPDTSALYFLNRYDDKLYEIEL